MFLFKKITVFKSKNLRVTGAAWVVCTVKIYNELKKNSNQNFYKTYIQKSKCIKLLFSCVNF